ncbi:MAG: FHA domain-containing protein [Patulibacter sp.]|nr:FHA domain-containing protein [Patulibacter sp.]
MADRIVRAETVSHPHLLVLLGDGRALVTVLKPAARLDIGRSQEADLPLAWDATVSSVHAVVERHLDLVTVEDLGPSRNGTFVNGTPITTRARLADRDIVRCGSTEILLRCPFVVELRETVPIPPTVDWALLSPTERRVLITMLDLWPLELRLQRAPSTEVLARELGLGESTVKTHLQSMFRKLAVYGVDADRRSLADAASNNERALRDLAGRDRP